MHVDLCEDALQVGDVVARVARDGAGAIDVFLGCVRDENEARRVVLLEYEAYRPMAIAEMQRIAEGIERQRPGVHVAVAHRVGKLKVGDLAVVCAASAPHRGEAFDACRSLIDEIKRSVPIWKREHGPDGAYWVGWHDARCSDAGHE